MDFFAVSFIVDMSNEAMNLLLFAYLNGADCYTNLYLHSNDMDSLKSLFLKNIH